MNHSRALSLSLLLCWLVTSATLAQAERLAMVAWIDEDEVGPGTGSPATGWGELVLDTVANTLDFRIDYRGLLGSEITAHFHGQSCNGQAILFGLGAGSPKVGVWNYPEAVECELLAGHFYVNIHTDLFPGGEIAGHLVLVPDTITSFCAGVGCPCGNDDAAAGCANSSGSGAHITTSGTGSVLHDDLVLRASPLPAGRLGLFFMGANATTMPFGDGLLCVGSSGPGTLQRYPALIHAGELVLGPGLVEDSLTRSSPAARIRPGETRYFQAWYEDTSGPCAQRFNTSDAIAVRFTL